MKKSKRIISALLSIFITIASLTVIFENKSYAYSQGYDGMGPVVISGGKRDFLWPVPNYYNLQSCFYDHRNHCAIDISAPINTPAIASYSGTVIKAVDGGTNYYGDGFGNYVVLKHNYIASNGTIVLYTRYSHLNSVSVKEGATVSAGTTIGKIGTTGSSEGYHLDFQILHGNWSPYQTYSIDPYSNQLLELPANLVVYDSWDCGKSYYSLVKSLYSNSLDTQAPTISNVKISNVTSAGYTVTCTVKDNIGVTRVAFPTWTHGSGQDDLLWKDGTISGSTATFTVKVSEHKNESGMYATHIYAYDAAGNSSTYAVDIDVPSTHTHSYTSTITTNPTCKTDGIRTYKCSCSASYTENIGKHPATHEGGTEIRNARASTCKDNGYSGDTYCKGCGVCLGFGTSTAKNYNNHTGGTTIKNTKNPTCTAEGYTGDTYCKGCDTKLSSGKAIAKIPHDYEEIARVYPTCTETGLITYACYCGASYDEVIPANGHTETAWIIHKAATCTSAGTKYKECTVCEELLDIEVIPVAPHDYDIVVTEETCTTDGYSTYTCPDCGDVYVGDKVPAAGHTESEWIIDLEATCTEKGSKHIECTVCGETLKTESIAKTPHDYNYVVTDATCETDGYTTVTCPDCGDTYITDEVPAFGHNDENKDTLCDACGLQLTCKHCGRPVHEGQTNEYLCIIIMTIKLLINFLNMVTK